MENPFAALSDADRTAAIQNLAQHHSEVYASSLRRLNELCRRYNFFQLLAHFAYYDQLLLDFENENPAYSPVEQSAVELLQALILKIPEHALQ